MARGGGGTMFTSNIEFHCPLGHTSGVKATSAAAAKASLAPE